MLERFLTNHVLANLTFAIVLVMGLLSYQMMPREQDPEINFNWISVTTTLPGASAGDVEKLVTNPLEDAIAKISDVKFVSSVSRESTSFILLRFNDIDQRTADKRINDLRRELQNKTDAELPDEAEDPYVMEITTSNNLPTAVVLVAGQSDDELLRRNAYMIKQDLERIKGVDKVNVSSLSDPELLVEFDPEALVNYNISATALANTVANYFKDTSAGEMYLADQEWLVRLLGTDSDTEHLGQMSIVGTPGELPVNQVATVTRGQQEKSHLAGYQGRPAVVLAVTKKGYTNTLDLIEQVNRYVVAKDKTTDPYGINVVLLDDQTISTREALSIMQTNALVGLLLVTLVTWAFLGSRIALFVGIGIPFSLAGAFWVLNIAGHTVNTSVLVGLVLVLGMLVDDAVVVVEAIYYRIQRGAKALQASIDALREVFTPVTASIITTMAAFLPLMLLPGILGKFMFVIPFVVTVALAISLIEAYWMLPVHVAAAKVNFDSPSRIHRYRVLGTRWLRHRYTQLLVKVMRQPKRWLAGLIVVILSAALVFAAGLVRVQFFSFDPMQLFYVNVEMPPGTPLETTMEKLVEVEAIVRRHMDDEEVRGIASIAGQMFTKMEPMFGDRYGQVLVSMMPHKADSRTVKQVVESMRQDVEALTGASNISFLRMEKGPPTTKPIQVKVRGDDFGMLRSATDALRDYVEAMPASYDVADDDSPGANELRLRFNQDAIRRAGLNPAELTRTVRMLFDGEIVAHMQHQGERVEVRVKADSNKYQDLSQLMNLPLNLPGGGQIPLGEVLDYESGIGKANIRHYNFRRTITLSADLDKEQMDTLEANGLVKEHWQQIAANYPGVELDFTGEMEDIAESLDAMKMLFLLGIGLIYLILGTQFRSYFQPFMILVTVPMAFAGVTFGLAVTQNPLSLYTLYGVVALAGISVNAAIVMIDAANQRLKAGMSVLHATIFAARRRVVPILITSMTTIAGLFSLATGLGGQSMMWGPLASAMVWGLAFSTVLTLLMIPLLYHAFMQKSHLNQRRK